ncbi:MAG: TrkH family potassium uptake protein [Bdellovibrionota bacterium]|nr:TrkH family potassium uptake protein [Bdellovibrionota bacterium]
MTRLYQNIPFFVELVLNGIFIILYSFYANTSIETSWISSVVVESLLEVFTAMAPFVVLISVLSYYIKAQNTDEFIRKYIFSVICIIPMFFTYGDIQFTFWLAAVHLFSSILSIYDSPFDIDEEVKPENTQPTIGIGVLEKIKLAPAQLVIFSFLGIIFFGTLLLLLPISAAPGKSIGLVDALFTATSATCVTGLATMSVADNFSFIGQVVILILIQIGGLGYMTLYSSMTILLGKSLAVRDQVLMQDLLDISSLEDLLQMIINIIKYTLVIELIGATILTLAFNMEGYEFGEALFYGIFHSVSAFCNAGFALFNDSLEGFQLVPMVHMTISALIFLGGLGFIVLKELEYITFKGGKIINLSVHSKIFLTTSISLVFMVAIYIFFSEFLHALDDLSIWEKVQVAFFQSMTTRTAGFNTLPLGALHPHTIYLFTLIMFIGASPGSTGGGIKTTTFAILFQSVKATLKGRDKVEFFDRKVPNLVVVRAIAIIVISLIIVSFFILLLMRLEPELEFLKIFFEVVSAFATVGLSLGVTPLLSSAGKFAIIFVMFIGRVGPLTLALALGQKNKDKGNVDYPEGRIMIG